MIPKLPYYAKRSAGRGQGLVIEETTGRTVALAYELEETPVLAAAPTLAAIVRDWVAMEEDGVNAGPAGRQEMLRRAYEILETIKEPM